MDTNELITHAMRIVQQTKKCGGSILGVYAEACEFLRKYAGTKNLFLLSLQDINPRDYVGTYVANQIDAALQGFIRYVKSGLFEGISPERKVQIDVVSDFLSQAQTLLESKGVHPASPAMIIGAALEEFLRNWIESAGLSMGKKKPGIENYATTLREAGLISKQDIKDITSWGGMRNHAAHGEWDQLSDKLRVNLMLEGVNLFMRRYTA